MQPDSLGDRMKAYEGVPKTRLMPKTPVMLRLDGKAFHTFTRGCMRPYDPAFHECMWRAAIALCEQVDGCRLAYVQSDEITLLLTDWQSQGAQPWFNYEVQKLCSVSAGICSVAFYAAWLELGLSTNTKRLPSFDARCWNLPVSEVVNAFIWRQQDASRNSVSMLAQAFFSPKQLHGVSMSGQQDMLMTKCDINWNDCPTAQKRGVCIVKETYTVPVARDDGTTTACARTRWAVDREIPLFTADRSYIESRMP